MSKNLKILVTIVAMLIVSAAAAFVIVKLTQRNRVDEANVTLFK